ADRVDAAVGVGQPGGPGGRPGLAVVFRLRLADGADAARPAQGHERLGPGFEEGWLDDAVGPAGHGDGAEAPPGLAIVGGALDPGGPGAVAFHGSSGQDDAVGLLDRLVLDGAQ